MKQLLRFFMGIFIIHAAHAESVYECKIGDKYKYQSTPCPTRTELRKIDIPAFKPDAITLERLDKQRMTFLQESNPAEFNRIRRAQMTPDERLADEKLEEERLQRNMQQLQAERELQVQREILLRQQQITEQMAQQQRQLEEQQAQSHRWQNLNLQPPYWPRHQDLQRPKENSQQHGRRHLQHP